MLKESQMMLATPSHLLVGVCLSYTPTFFDFAALHGWVLMLRLGFSTLQPVDVCYVCLESENIFIYSPFFLLYV